jgi:hypothetical protein
MPEQLKATPAATYVIFDVDVYDPAQYQKFMYSVQSAVENAGGKYLVRGGAHNVHEGDWQPRPNCVAGVSVAYRVGVVLLWTCLSRPEGGPRPQQLRTIGQRPGSGKRDRQIADRGVFRQRGLHCGFARNSRGVIPRRRRNA